MMMIMTGISITRIVAEHGLILRWRGKIRNIILSFKRGQA
jgi:hypothetical protein